MVGGDSARRNFTAQPLPQQANVLWTYQLVDDEELRGPGGFTSASQIVVWEDGTSYAALGSKVHAVAPDGKRKWAWASKTPIISLALGRQGHLYCLADGMLYALNPDGTQQWQVEVDVELSEARPLVVGQGGTIYVSGREYLYAVTSAGDRKWRFQGGRISAGPAEMRDGKLLVMIRDKLYLLTRDGDTVWERETTMPLSFLSLSTYEDRIYLVGEDRMSLHADSRTITQAPGPGAARVIAVGKDFVQDGFTRYDQNWDQPIWTSSGPPLSNGAISIVDAEGNAVVLTSGTGQRGAQISLVQLLDSQGTVKWVLPDVLQILALPAPAGEGRLLLMGYLTGKPGVHLIMVGDS